MMVALPPPPRNALSARASGTISPARRALIYGRDGYRCRDCGTEDSLTVDHVTPRAEGGDNAFSNLQTLCTDCNNRKADHVLVRRRRLRRQLAYETYVYLTSMYSAAEVAHLLPGLVADYAAVRAEMAAPKPPDAPTGEAP